MRGRGTPCVVFGCGWLCFVLLCCRVGWVLCVGVERTYSHRTCCPIVCQIQASHQWKHNRFDAYKPNTNATATRNLPPGTNGDTATLQMLQTINKDKEQVTRLCNQGCVTLWLEAADVCNLTYACPYKPDTRLSCRQPREIGLAWKQCSGPANCKRMAFIFDYYGAEVYRRALSTTHQEETTKHIMASMGIAMDVRPAEMRGGQKTCIQQQYSYCAKNHKNNILRVGWKKHHVRVNREQGKTRTNRNWKRPKEVFFNTRMHPNLPGETIVEKVSTYYRLCCSFAYRDACVVARYMWLTITNLHAVALHYIYRLIILWMSNGTCGSKWVFVKWYRRMTCQPPRATGAGKCTTRPLLVHRMAHGIHPFRWDTQPSWTIRSLFARSPGRWTQKMNSTRLEAI